MFEAILAGGFRGDIAIDDISYVAGTCTVSPSAAVPVRPTTTPRPTLNPTTPGMYRCLTCFAECHGREIPLRNVFG